MRFPAAKCCVAIFIGLTVTLAAAVPVVGQQAHPGLETPAATPQMGGMASGTGGGGMGGLSYGSMQPHGMGAMPFHKWVRKPFHTPMAEATRSALGEPYEGPRSFPLNELAQAAGVPVRLDPRGLRVAEATADQVVQIPEGDLTLRAALALGLAPLDLEVRVQPYGLLVKPNYVSLTRAGKFTDRWLNVPDQPARALAEKLAQPVQLDLRGVPLTDLTGELARQIQAVVRIDRQALEEIGLTDEPPVRIELSGVPAREALRVVLEQLDLTYVNRGYFLEITTFETAESRLLNRVYWLEGIGLQGDNIDAAIESIQMTIEPDTWETLGGPSTMYVVDFQERRALLVSATTPVHEQIEELLRTFREAHFETPAAYQAVPQSDAEAAATSHMPGGMM